ncbi:MAG: ATP-binding protein [Fermentimonas sp.]|jgi:NtrC-family two-component system sensor histidine kinase KinB
MRIKSKLVTGIGALFLLIVFLSILSIYSIKRLSDDTKFILEDNYNSVKYAREMLMLLDADMQDSLVIADFETNLRLQKSNITETGEKDYTQALENNYLALKKNPTDTTIYYTLREDLLNISGINMEAIQKKSDSASVTADNAIFWLLVGCCLCLIIGLLILFYMPRNIVKPIDDFTKSIQHIAERNYSERISLNRNDEFRKMMEAFNKMAEKLQEYNNSNLAKVLTEKNRIESLINNIHEPIIGLDENFKILFMNSEALQIFNLKNEDVMGKSAQDIAVNNDLMRTLIQDFFDNSSKSSMIKIFINDKESYFQKEVAPMNIASEDGLAKKHIGNVIFLKNITSLKELDFAKTNFMATISHELKTPIYSMKMSVQLLENVKIGKLNDEQLTLTESIKEDLDRLLSIIGELLNISQIETGNIQLSIIQTDAKEILDYAVRTTQMQARQKDIAFSISCPKVIPMVLADPEKTAWVLINLIINAIRYSHEGDTVYLTISETENGVMFSVKDHGQGILPEYQERIFDRYFKIPGSNKSGSGLGLAISKEFIEAQGGKISLKSEYGEGSEFIVTLNKGEERNT